jgi:uncharacterized protein
LLRGAAASRSSRRPRSWPKPRLCDYRSLVHAAEGRYVLAAMSETNKAILEEANAAISEGNYEGFLACCADDTEWMFVGGETLKGKEAVRQWMATTYQEPPKFAVTQMIADGDFVVALGDITSKDEHGHAVPFSYCDVWRFRGGKMVELRAFVIKAR